MSNSKKKLEKFSKTWEEHYPNPNPNYIKNWLTYCVLWIVYLCFSIQFFDNFNFFCMSAFLFFRFCCFLLSILLLVSDMKNISIAFLNVRSLCLSFEDLKTLVYREIWRSECCGNLVNQNISIDGCNIVREDRRARGGGVAIYYKSNLRIDALDNPSFEDLEHKCVSVHISKHKYKYTGCQTNVLNIF